MNSTRRSNRPTMTPQAVPRLGRSLLKAGFIDANENELLQCVCGAASAKVWHSGVISEVWSRSARRMVFTAGQWMIRRYAAWKSAARAALIRCERRETLHQPSSASSRAWISARLSGSFIASEP